MRRSWSGNWSTTVLVSGRDLTCGRMFRRQSPDLIARVSDDRDRASDSNRRDRQLRQVSFRRGINMTRLQGMVRLSSCWLISFS